MALAVDALRGRASQGGDRKDVKDSEHLARSGATEQNFEVLATALTMLISFATSYRLTLNSPQCRLK